MKELKSKHTQLPLKKLFPINFVSALEEIVDIALLALLFLGIPFAELILVLERTSIGAAKTKKIEQHRQEQLQQAASLFNDACHGRNSQKQLILDEHVRLGLLNKIKSIKSERSY